jgi:hypothetical protein
MDPRDVSDESRFRSVAEYHRAKRCPFEHPHCVLLPPGGEADYREPPFYCAYVRPENGIAVVSTCKARPMFRCTDCGALICEQHGGKRCGYPLCRGSVLPYGMPHWHDVPSERE